MLALLRTSLVKNVPGKLRGIKTGFQCALMSTIYCSPTSALVDEDLSIGVKGLEPYQKVTLQSYLKEAGFDYISCGHYVADSEGNIDCVKDECVGGTYDGIERHGLIWSLIQAPGQRPGLRLLKRDVSQPYDWHFLLHDGHKHVERCYDEMGSALSRTMINRTYMAPGVTRQLVKHCALRGVLFTPPGTGPFPAVVDLFGGAGGIVEFRAALLASYGIMSLHLAYFNYEGLQQGLKLIDFDYFEEGVDFLLMHPNTLGDKIGVVGVSKGGEISFGMASYIPPHKLGAIVSINGFDFVYEAQAVYKNRIIPATRTNLEFIETTPKGSVIFSPCVVNLQPKPESIYPVENADAKFLIISSEDDHQIPPVCSYRAVERLAKSGKDNYEHMVLGKGVGHLVEPCHAPMCSESYHANMRVQLSWGGEPKPHARAQEYAWPKIKQFLHETLGDQTNNTSKL